MDKKEDPVGVPKNETNWQFTPNGEDETNLSSPTAQASTDQSLAKPIHWSADDLASQDKSFLWYLILVLATLFIAALIYLVTRDKITSGVVVLAGFIFGVYGGHKPHNIEYSMNSTGLSIGSKFYDYSTFRSFSMINDRGTTSLLFVPLKRFMPMTTVYYKPNDEKEILDFLNSKLPLDNRGNDIFDRFLRNVKY